jgi:hypothetical protein
MTGEAQANSASLLISLTNNAKSMPNFGWELIKMGPLYYQAIKL